MKKSFFRYGVVALSALCALTATDGWSWDRHQALMPYVYHSLPATVQEKLGQVTPAPCSEKDQETAQILIHELALNPETKLSEIAPGSCTAKPINLSGKQVLLGEAPVRLKPIDEPDFGMDQNLPEPYDPENERRFMGGLQGPTSQGFRHMYFGGWKLTSPISTFQVPIGAIGQAPARVRVIAEKARDLIREGRLLWGARALGWSMHYLQDLAQPFHSAQIPSLRMVPWSALFEWPPSQGFQNLVSETTRTISNYHFAYEHYVRTLMLSTDRDPFRKCLSEPADYSTLKFGVGDKTDPAELARQIHRASLELAPKVGRALVQFFGKGPMSAGVDLPQGKGELDYPALSQDPGLQKAREKLHEVTCEALSNAILVSKALTHWTFEIQNVSN